MLSNLLAIDNSFKTFFTQLTDSLGYAGFLGIFLGVEALFVALFIIKSIFSYEARLKRSLDRANTWLFKYKKIDVNNIKTFNAIIKTGPKRFVYYWQQYILYRDGGPSAYMSEENIIEKPLRTSSWKSNVKNLGILTVVWAVVSFVFGLASQYTPQQQYLSFQATAVALVIPALILLIGTVSIIFIKGKRVLNLDDIYHLYHLFSRFLNNACADLPEFIDFDLLFTAKEIEKGNAQLREYYEARARKAKEEFENAKHDKKNIEYNFEEVGVDGKLLLNRAMKESETYINKKTTIESRMAQVEAQKDALRRNYENVQMDLQRKIQASKENIQKLIEQQAATTSRVEVGLLRQQQEKEVNKQEALQKDYDQEEARYKLAKDERDREIQELRAEIDESILAAEKGMSAEYKSFFDKVMKSAYAVVEKRIEGQMKEVESARDKNETELINVQTQIKRLHDENEILRARIEELTAQKLAAGEEVPETQMESEGHYDEEGNYIYPDGSYHDTKGLFHDVDGKIYDMNGVQVGVDEEELSDEAKQANLEQAQIEQFGSYVAVEDTEAQEETTEEKPEEKLEELNGEVVLDEKPVEVAEEGKSEEVAEEKEETVETVIEEATEEIEEGNAEEIKQEEPAPRKRGRPRKETTEKTENKSPAKRGRPRKSAEEKTETKPAKRGRPRKSAVKTEEKPVGTAAKRGRPKKETSAKNEDKPKSSTAKRGRPKKTGSTAKPKTETINKPAKRGRPKKVEEETKQDLDTLSRINQLISEEEAKLSRMKALLNSEIDQVMVQDTKEEVEKEKDSIMEAVETLKEQANDVEKNEKSNEELATINKRLEDLIKEISVLNNKK